MIRPCRLIHSSETAEQRHERLAMEYLQMAINRLAEAVDLSLTLTSAKVRVFFCRLHVYYWPLFCLSVDVDSFVATE